MIRMPGLLLGAFLAFAVALMPSTSLRAQSLASDVNATGVLTNSLRTSSATAATSVNQTNTYNRGVTCSFSTNVSSGSTSTTFGIQAFDAATATWVTLKTSAAIIGGPYATDAINTPHVLTVYPGMATTGLPTNYEAASLPLPKTWRVTQTITAGAGSNPAPAISGKIGCGYLN